MLVPVATAVVARTLATGIQAVEIGADELATWIGVTVGAIAILGFLFAIFRVVDWLRKQMAENGHSKEARTEGHTWRDVQDRQLLALEAIDADVRSLQSRLDVFGASHERIEVNQREQGRALRETIRKFDDHLLEATEAIRRLDDHIADHSHNPQENP